jgi:hypothetical protein
MLSYRVATGATPCSPGYAFVQIPSDGSTSSGEEFVIPDGQALVITDVDWGVSAVPGLPFGAGRIIEFSLYTRPNFERVFQTSATIDANMASAGLWKGTTAMTTGVIIKPGATLCPTTQQSTTNSTITADVGSAKLRGYLIKSK